VCSRPQPLPVLSAASTAPPAPFCAPSPALPCPALPCKAWPGSQSQISPRWKLILAGLRQMTGAPLGHVLI
jgi:hypothetical protein